MFYVPMFSLLCSFTLTHPGVRPESREPWLSSLLENYQLFPLWILFFCHLPGISFTESHEMHFLDFWSMPYVSLPFFYLSFLFISLGAILHNFFSLSSHMLIPYPGGSNRFFQNYTNFFFQWFCFSLSEISLDSLWDLVVSSLGLLISSPLLKHVKPFLNSLPLARSLWRCTCLVFLNYEHVREGFICGDLLKASVKCGLLQKGFDLHLPTSGILPEFTEPYW